MVTFLVSIFNASKAFEPQKHRIVTLELVRANPPEPTLDEIEALYRKAYEEEGAIG